MRLIRNENVGGRVEFLKKGYGRALLGLVLILSAAGMVACSGTGSPSTLETSTGASTASLASLSGAMNVNIMDANGATVYSDSNSQSSLTFKAGTNYELDLNVSGFPAGTTFALQMTDIDTPAGSMSSIPLSPGANTLNVSIQGDYAWKLVASNATASSETKSYLANVTCTSPTFTQASLNPSAISVTAGSGSNLYNFSSSGVVANANGMGPYLCEWDPTGTGIVDTGFADCSTALNNFYVNYVNARSVGLIVKDACNTTYEISNPAALSYSEPSMPGNVFVYGQVSNAAGSAASDPRIDNVTYLATNSGGNDFVQPHYSGGSFNITAATNYGLSSSVPFGVKINVKGIQDNINVSTGTGSIDAANAYISSLTYTTDEAGDAEPALNYTSTNCTLTNPNARVLFTQGTPCSSGMSGDNNQATVEVWGHYSCNISNGSGGSAVITGDFDGYTNLVDNCVGGGGGGGGGIVPIQL